MKAKLFIITMFLSLLSFIFVGCSDDDKDFIDVDGLAPKIDLTTSHIRTELNRDFYIEGEVVDQDGLKSIHLFCKEIHLDKTISFSADSIIKMFDLNYKFRLRKDLSGESFDIKISATDLGNRTSEETILLTTDGDFTSPRFLQYLDKEITVLIKDETKLNVKFKVEDNRALDKVEVTIPELGYIREITEFSNNGKTLDFQEFLLLPSEVGVYNLEIVAFDKAGLKVVSNSIISVSEMPDFEKMYLADVETVAELNNDVFGVPMLIDRTAPYTYKARYYSEKAGTELFFIPQKTDFSPISFGLDPSNKTILTDDPEVALPIVIDSEGYKEITFNILSGDYSITAYQPEDSPIEIGKMVYLDEGRPEEGMMALEIGLIGSGLPDSGDWDPSNPHMLQQNEKNPYVLESKIKLEKGDVVEFIISARHSWGWWPEPFWRWDRAEDPEYNVLNNGENPGKWEIKESGTYRFAFDSHLKRSKFYLID